MVAEPKKVVPGDWDAGLGRPEVICQACEATFDVGAEFVSVLQTDEASALQRRELCPGCYDGLPEGAVFAFWRARVQAGEEQRRRPLDLNFLVDLFRRLGSRDGESAHEGVAYIVALLLVRRKVLAISRSEPTDEGGERLVLRFVKGEDEAEYPVPVPELSQERLDSIKDDLGRIFNLEGNGEAA